MRHGEETGYERTPPTAKSLLERRIELLQWALVSAGATQAVMSRSYPALAFTLMVMLSCTDGARPEVRPLRAIAPQPVVGSGGLAIVTEPR